MNNENSATERKSLGYSEFREEIIRPWLKEIWYLRIPALVAVLSFIIFALVDQTIEVYRIFYQQQLWQHISYSVLLFALAFSICYSGRTISFTRIEKENEDDFFARIKGKDFKLKEITTRILNLLKKEIQKKQSKVTALIWLPRFFGLFPLFGYLVGIIRAVGFNIEMCLPITLMGVYWIFIVFQKWVEHRKVKKNEEKKYLYLGRNSSNIQFLYSSALFSSLPFLWLSIIML